MPCRKACWASERITLYRTTFLQRMTTYCCCWVFPPYNNYNIGGIWGKIPICSHLFFFLEGGSWWVLLCPMESQVPKWRVCLAFVGSDLNPKHDDNPSKSEFILAWESGHHGTGLATHWGSHLSSLSPQVLYLKFRHCKALLAWLLQETK